ARGSERAQEGEARVIGDKPKTPGTPDGAPKGLAVEQPMTLDLGGNPGRYQIRFGAVYASLGAVLVAAAVAFVVLVVQPGRKPPAQWSDWQPAPGTAAKMTSEI